MSRSIFRISVIAAVVLTILSLVDATLTVINIREYGMDVEWNPWMRFLIETFGMWIMFVIKGFFGAWLIWLLFRTNENHLRKWIIPAMFWMIGIYTVIVFYGYQLLNVL